MRRWAKATLLVVLLLGAAGAVYRLYPPREKLERVTVISVGLGTVEETVSATGAVQANRAVVVTTEPGARIVALYFRERDRVKQGQLLAKLDDAELTSQLSQNQAGLELAVGNLASAQVQLERLRRLHEKGFAARQEVEAAERQIDLYRTQAEERRAAIELVKAKQRRALILAPISGVVTRKFVEVGGVLGNSSDTRAGRGERLEPMAIAEIAELEPVEFHAEVDQADIPKIRIGQKATVRLDTFPGRAFDAATNEVGLASTPDVAGRVRYRVKLRVSQPDGLLKVGMTGTVSFIIARRAQVLALPAPLILQQGEDEFVVVLAGDRVHLRKIRTGLRGEELLEIASGLKAGELVVDQGRAKLKDGQRVEVLNANR
jgi:RND family efflux transporter MFP subunit